MDPQALNILLPVIVADLLLCIFEGLPIYNYPLEKWNKWNKTKPESGQDVFTPKGLKTKFKIPGLWNRYTMSRGKTETALHIALAEEWNIWHALYPYFWRGSFFLDASVVSSLTVSPAASPVVPFASPVASRTSSAVSRASSGPAASASASVSAVLFSAADIEEYDSDDSENSIHGAPERDNNLAVVTRMTRNVSLQ